MGKANLKYDQPTPSYPYKIKHRFNMLTSTTRKLINLDEGLPTRTPRGIRTSALKAQPNDRVIDCSWPYLWRLLLIKRLYKKQFPPERIERIERMIEASNATIYSKLANCAIDLKKLDVKDVKKKKGWSDSDWKKHMEYIGNIAGPRRDFAPPPVPRGERKPLEQLLPRIYVLSTPAEFKIFKRVSQEKWYRDPVKVSPAALKYVISERIKKIALPRVIPQEQ